METSLTYTDLSVAIETLFTSAAIRLGCVVTDGVGVTLIMTRPTSVNCKQQHTTLNSIHMSMLSCRLRGPSPFIRAMGCRYLRCATFVIAGQTQYDTSHCKPLLFWFPLHVPATRLSTVGEWRPSVPCRRCTNMEQLAN